MKKIDQRGILKTLAIILPILFIYYVIIASPLFIFTFLVEISLITWLKNKGKWKTKIGSKVAEKWTKSLLFNLYIFFLLFALTINIWMFSELPKYTSDELEFNMKFLMIGAFLLGVMVINIIAMFIFMRTDALKQILLIPILSILIGDIQSVFVSIGLHRVGLNYYIYPVLLLMPVLWIFYVRFIFLRRKKWSNL